MSMARYGFVDGAPEADSLVDPTPDRELIRQGQ
jgi:hypothetical protein